MMEVYFTSDQWLLLFLGAASPACILPVITGLVFLGSNMLRHDDLNMAAAAFALKPLLATPIWAAVAVSIGANDQYYFSTILPGMLITLAIVIAFRNLFKSHTVLFSLLLVGDVIRWVSTFVMFAPWLDFSVHNESRALDVWYPIALLLPNAYAAAVLLMAFLRARQRDVWSRAVTSSQ